MNDNKLEMNEIERQAEETVNSIEKSIVPFLFFLFFGGMPLILPFILLFLEFLGYSRNVFLIFAIILMVIFLFICFLISYIEEKKFKKILKNNEEYRLAKEIMEKYNKKAENYVLKKRIKTQFLEEQQKTKKILEMKEYEKMVSELIKEKKKIKMNFEKVYISLVLVFIVLFAVFGMFLFQKGKINFEDFFLIILFGGIISFFFGICFTAIVYIFLKILKFITLLKDKEYKLAKEVIKNYENKVFEYKKKKVEEKKRNEYKDVIYKEKEKHERINELEKYLANERKRKRKEKK